MVGTGIPQLVYETKSSHDTVEDIEKTLVNLLEIGARHETCLKSLLESHELSKGDVNNVIETYEALKDIENHLVKIHSKWVDYEEIG